MKLVVRHTIGKLPFIGAIYDRESEAVKEFPPNSENIELNVEENYGRISLRLYKDKKLLLFHRLIEYDHKEYRQWRAYQHLGINYGHCYIEKNQLHIARFSNGKPCVFKPEKFISI